MHNQTALLNKNEQELLLQLARTSIEYHIAGKQYHPPAPASPLLNSPTASFVSLHLNDDLRGCIGTLEAHEPLYQSVMTQAVNAATRDPRFHPVAALELAALKIEISVLAPPSPIADIEQFLIGRHGIILEHGYARAVFLPQVATDQGWDRETTLTWLARKAGLPDQAWLEPETILQIFTAEVFAEA